MENDLLVYAGIGIFMFLILMLFFYKDAEANRKFVRFERIIEDLIQQNHRLRREFLEMQNGEKSRYAAFEKQLHNKVQDEINTNVFPLLETLKEIENVMQDFKDEQQERMFSLEEQTKSMKKFATPVNATNDKMIIQFYKEGKRIGDIAKDLRIGVGEVEFILKMNNLL